jgi:hypothetical protein
MRISEQYHVDDNFTQRRVLLIIHAENPLHAQILNQYPIHVA